MFNFIQCTYVIFFDLLVGWFLLVNPMVVSTLNKVNK